MQVLWRVVFSAALGVGFFYALVWAVAHVITMDLSPEYMSWWNDHPNWGRILMYARTTGFAYIPVGATAGLILVLVVRQNFVAYGVIAAAATLAVSEMYALPGWIGYADAHPLADYTWWEWARVRFDRIGSNIEYLWSLAVVPLFAWLWGKKFPTPNIPLEDD